LVCICSSFFSFLAVKLFGFPFITKKLFHL
jgi:hypothetical protein